MQEAARELGDNRDLRDIPRYLEAMVAGGTRKGGAASFRSPDFIQAQVGDRVTSVWRGGLVSAFPGIAILGSVCPLQASLTMHVF